MAAVKAAGLVDTLQGTGPFTVFAPTNAAFDKLPAGTVDTLLKPENKATLTKVLTYHVVAGRLSSKDLKAANQGEVTGIATVEDGQWRHALGDASRRRHRAEGREGRVVDDHASQRLSIERRHSRNRHRCPTKLTAINAKEGRTRRVKALRVRSST